MPKGSDAMTWMAGELLGMSEKVYRRQLMERVFRGSSAQPHEVKDATEAASMVARTPGALAALPVAAIGGGVRVVSLD